MCYDVTFGAAVVGVVLWTLSVIQSLRTSLNQASFAFSCCMISLCFSPRDKLCLHWSENNITHGRRRCVRGGCLIYFFKHPACFASACVCLLLFISPSCDDTREFFGLWVYGWRALTEGHGSCTLSVWTLAEPLGVLFQARSDNLAPMTRLATAQFTGRSSTHAQPPPPPLPPPPPTSLPHPLSTSPLHPPSPLYLPLLSVSSSMLCFFTTPPAFPSFSLFLSRSCQQDRNCLLASRTDGVL